MKFLALRSLQPEIMDVERPPLERLEKIYRFLKFANQALGSTRALRSELGRFSTRWPHDRPVRILDVATGMADVPRGLADWARRKGKSLRIVGLDLEKDTLSLARRETADYPEIELVEGDARALPFADGAFDYVITNHFFHHLKDEEVVALLRRFDRIASRGIVVVDLLRRIRLYLWMHLFTRFSDPIVRHDGLLSVRKSFTLDEIRAVAHRAGLGYLKARAVFGHRFVLSGEKGD